MEHLRGFRLAVKKGTTRELTLVVCLVAQKEPHLEPTLAALMALNSECQKAS